MVRRSPPAPNCIATGKPATLDKTPGPIPGSEIPA
jgi:hypothetical protein